MAGRASGDDAGRGILARVAPAAPDGAPYEGVPLPEDTEARLIERLVARDERAFNDVVRAYERRIFALAFRMMGDRAEAEDLAQEVFVQVFKAIGTFRGESKLSTWIYRIAVNLSKNRAKYLRVRHSGEQDELGGDRELGAGDVLHLAGLDHDPHGLEGRDGAAFAPEASRRDRPVALGALFL